MADSSTVVRSLNLVTSDVSILDFLGSNKNPSTGNYELDVTVVLERKINGVFYIFCVVAEYLTIFARNNLDGTYLPVDGDNIDLIINTLISQETETLSDLLDKPTSRLVVTNEEMFCVAKVDEAISEVFELIDTSKKKIIDYKVYCKAVLEFVKNYVPSYKLTGVDWTTYIPMMRQASMFGIKNCVDVKNIEKYEDKFIVYLAHLLYTDRLIRMTGYMTAVAKQLLTIDNPS